MKPLLAVAAAAVSLFAAGSALAGQAEDVIAANKCTKCHTEKTTKKAPSFAAVAKKHAGKADAADKLFKELKAGGKVGDEEDHAKVKGSDADIKAVVEMVLSSK